MAFTTETAAYTEDLLRRNVAQEGSESDPLASQIADLIANLLLLLPDDETANEVADLAVQFSSEERAGL
jgi:hypothetical protein